MRSRTRLLNRRKIAAAGASRSSLRALFCPTNSADDNEHCSVPTFGAYSLFVEQLPSPSAGHLGVSISNLCAFSRFSLCYVNYLTVMCRVSITSGLLRSHGFAGNCKLSPMQPRLTCSKSCFTSCFSPPGWVLIAILADWCPIEGTMFDQNNLKKSNLNPGL